MLSLAALMLLAGWSYGLNQEAIQLRAALAAEKENAAEQARRDLSAVQALKRALCARV